MAVDRLTAIAQGVPAFTPHRQLGAVTGRYGRLSFGGASPLPRGAKVGEDRPIRRPWRGSASHRWGLGDVMRSSAAVRSRAPYTRENGLQGRPFRWERCPLIAAESRACLPPAAQGRSARWRHGPELRAGPLPQGASPARRRRPGGRFRPFPRVSLPLPASAKRLTEPPRKAVSPGGRPESPVSSHSANTASRAARFSRAPEAPAWQLTDGAERINSRAFRRR